MRGRRVKARTGSCRSPANRETCEKQWTDWSNIRNYGNNLPIEKVRQCLLQPRKVVSWLKLSQEVGCTCKDEVNRARLLITLFIVLHSHFNNFLLKKKRKKPNQTNKKGSLLLKIKHCNLKKNRQGLQWVVKVTEFVARRSLMLELGFPST